VAKRSVLEQKLRITIDIL